jgi:two-component system phosphate regulon sensor histidine kinase PhoR
MKTVFRNSLRVLLLTAVGMSFIFILSVMGFMDSLYYETYAGNLLDTARTLLPLMPDDVAAWFGELRNTSPYRFTFIQPDGQVIADSQIDAVENMENHRNRPEVVAALAGREGSVRRDSSSLGSQFIYAALPVYGPNGEITGVFRLSHLVPSFNQRVSSAALPFFLIATLVIIAACGVVFLFSLSLSRALNRLVRIAQAAAADPPAVGASVPITQNTREFMVVEGALRSMAAELSRRIGEARAEGGRLEAILNGMTEGVFAMDDRLMLHLANPQAREIFAIEGDVQPGSLSLLAATYSAELEGAANRVLKHGAPEELHVKFHIGGVQRHFRVFAAPFRAAGDKTAPEGVVMVLSDITRLMKLEQVRKDFVANVSHELRTPIQLVKGFSENLLESPPDDPDEIRHCIEIIQKNAQGMENLVNDLLALVSLEDEGNPRPGMEETDVSVLLEEAVGAVRFQAKNKDIAITVQCPAGLTAKLYGSFIIQAVINLLDNALKYSPAGSRVRAGAYVSGEELAIEVQDQGIGIPQEHLERIFERFYRVDRARSREAGGTGLGLSIVRHIALIHQGRVEVESHAGEGSLFRIVTPRGPLGQPDNKSTG